MFDLFSKLKEAGIKPNKMLLGYVLQSAIRKSDTPLIIEALEKFLEIGHEPDDRLIKKLSLSKNLDD